MVAAAPEQRRARTGAVLGPEAGMGWRGKEWPLTAAARRFTIASLMSDAYRLSLLGLRDLERETIHSCLRLLAARVPRYELAPWLDDCDFVIADADHAPSVQLVLATERMGRTLFVGTTAPAGAVAFMARPIDPKLLLRELDALVAQSVPVPQPAPQPAPYSGEADRRRQSVVATTVAAAPTPVSPSTPAPTALLVDDSEIALRFLETHLQRFGLVMERALSSGRAIELLSQRNYDFVFLDVELGTASDLDGLALCRHIKRHPGAGSMSTSAVFMVSAHASEVDRVRGTLAGCDGYLGKPLDAMELQRLMLRHGLKPAARVARDAN